MKKDQLTRRKFIETAAASAATISIVPSHVLGGSGKIAPSDKITVANIGCGTQGLREMGGLLQDERIQLVAVCDPNKFTTNYIDWSPHGIRDDIRRVLDDNSWWEGVQGIPGGRDVAEEYVNAYYAKKAGKKGSKACASYEDFRELFAREKDIDVVKIMTPDHLHATIAIAAMDRGIHVVTHKPIANRMEEGRLTIDKARETGVITHLLAWSNRPEYEKIKGWINAGEIGTLREIHNWSYRPVWEQWTKRPSETPPVPAGFNWDLWLGPVPNMPYHPNYTHNVFRGWYDFGGGSIADMGHYSLFPLFETLGIDRSPVSARAFGTTTREAKDNVYHWVENDVAFPHSCMIKLKFPEQKSLPSFDLIWYDGGMKPFATEELEADGKDIPSEGLMFVGDKGKILGGFRGEDPRLIPDSRMAGLESVDSSKVDRDTEIWIDRVREKKQTPGSFLRAQTITDTINLAAIALRSNQRIDFDPVAMKITNDAKANALLKREYRKGWELS